MAKIPLGFIKGHSSKEEKGVQEKIALHGIDAEFDKMTSLLQLGKKQLVSNLKLEKKIKRELVRIHKRIVKVEKDLKVRQTLLAQIYAVQRDDPQRALDLLEKV